MLCADLVDVWWTDQSGETVKVLANLEDISNSGACLQMDVPVASGVIVHIDIPNTDCEGRVRYCVYRDTGFFVGVQFEEGFHWDERLFQPKHLLDPTSLLGLEPKGTWKAPMSPKTDKIQ